MSAETTMTRERMRSLQQTPKQRTRVLVRTGMMGKNGVEPYRGDVIAIAEHAFGERNLTDPQGWWPELAPLTPAERKEVRAVVALTKAA